jgi:flavin-dependent dehydrogenase
MKTDIIEADVLCIGGGPTGLMAAIRAAELGAKVVVADKCNTLHSGSGKTWHSMLRTGGLRWTRSSQAGIVRWERKGEHSRDLLRDGVLSERGRRPPSRPHPDFTAHGRTSARDMGSPKN